MAFIMVFLLLTLGKSITCAPRDLSGKMFTFPRFFHNTHVGIVTPSLNMSAATVCLRFFTDIRKEYGLFSMTKPNDPNVFHLIVNRLQTSDIFIAVNKEHVSFQGHSVKLNAWQSVCATWSADTGMTQLWVNGHPSSRKYTSRSNMDGVFTINLGRTQDTVRGIAPSSTNSFVGMMSDLNMWNYVLDISQIQKYSKRGPGPFTNGNILNSASLEFQTGGSVLIEDELKL